MGFLAFQEGRIALGSGGLPNPSYFLLSTKSVDGFNPHVPGCQLGRDDIGEISGTGYVRKSQARPVPADNAFAYAAMTWSTGSATDWPTDVCSVVLVSSADNSGVAFGAWDLQDGGLPRDLSKANTNEVVAPILRLPG